MMKSYAICSVPSRMWIIPLSSVSTLRTLPPISHLVGISVIRSAVVVAQCLCSGDPYFTKMMACDPQMEQSIKATCVITKGLQPLQQQFNELKRDNSFWLHCSFGPKHFSVFKNPRPSVSAPGIDIPEVNEPEFPEAGSPPPDTLSEGHYQPKATLQSLRYLPPFVSSRRHCIISHHEKKGGYSATGFERPHTRTFLKWLYY